MMWTMVMVVLIAGGVGIDTKLQFPGQSECLAAKTRILEEFRLSSPNAGRPVIVCLSELGAD
jgi:hypothetical protein